MKRGNQTEKIRKIASRKRTAVLGVAVAAATTATLGLALPAGATATPAARTGTEHFQAMNTTTSETSTTNPVIAWGVFTAGGIDHERSNNVDTFAFPRGSFTVKHAPKAGSTHQSFNAKTCLFVFSQKGTFKLSGGTGAYRGISGNGTYSLSVIGIGQKLKNGTCNPSQTAPAVAQQQLITATGRVRLP